MESDGRPGAQCFIDQRNRVLELPNVDAMFAGGAEFWARVVQDEDNPCHNKARGIFLARETVRALEDARVPAIVQIMQAVPATSQTGFWFLACIADLGMTRPDLSHWLDMASRCEGQPN